MKVEGVQNNSMYSVNTNNPWQGSRRMERQDAAARESSMYNEKEVDIASEKKINEEQLQKAIDKANESFQPFDRRFERSVHEKTNTIMVKVIDTMNDEVIREIPPEKLLDMVANMLETAGILVDEKV